MAERIAIIGTGIAGMASAYHLRDQAVLTLYEREAQPGGHTHTVDVREGEHNVPIDTGFMVFNRATYPLLTALFEELDVKVKPTDMSFGVQHLPSGLEYASKGVFAQHRNRANPRFLRMLADVVRFNRTATRVLDDHRYAYHTIDDYVTEKRYSRAFVDRYLVPMTAAIWSTPPHAMLDFPIRTLVRFMHNHNLLTVKEHHPWLTVVGGSRQYRDKIMATYRDRVRLGCAATFVIRDGFDEVTVVDAEGGRERFDRVIIATHADEALGLLADPSDTEKQALAPWSYNHNPIHLHTDESVMPKARRAWASWNYRLEREADGQLRASTIYWMNSLQGVSDRQNYFVSVDDRGAVDPSKVLYEKVFTHPRFSREAVAAQPLLRQLNTSDRTHFVGSYYRYGFHEDALLAAHDLCTHLGALTSPQLQSAAG